MTDDDRVDALLRQMAAEEYNRPPRIVPREQMWDAVQRGLGTGDVGLGEKSESGSLLPFRRRVPRWMFVAVAAVLLLAVGIQVGRLLGPAAPPLAKLSPPASVTPDSLGVPGIAPDSRSVPAPTTDVARNDEGGKGPPRPKGGPERQLDPGLGDEVAARAYTVATAQHLTEAEAMLTAFKGDLSQGRLDAEIASWGRDLLSNTRLLLDSPAARDPVRRKLLQDLELVLVQIVQLSPKSPARDRDLIEGALTDDQVLTRLRTAIPIKGT